MYMCALYSQTNMNERKINAKFQVAKPTTAQLALRTQHDKFKKKKTNSLRTQKAEIKVAKENEL